MITLPAFAIGRLTGKTNFFVRRVRKFLSDVSLFAKLTA
jgi:hypothetical protein